MKKIPIFSLLLAILLSSMQIYCHADTVYTGALSAVLWDTDNKEVIYGHNETAKLPMASTTKIMTAIVALEQCDPDALVTIPQEAVGVEGSDRKSVV